MDTRINQKPEMYRTKKKKKRFFSFKRLLIVIILFFIAYFSLYLLILSERPDKSFFDVDQPLVIAHRGGSNIAPENTLVAFEMARSMGVDVIEFDIHMTKDGHLVVIHDEEVDRTTNGEGRVDEFTLDELRQLDAAYHFRDIRGRYIYRGKNVQIPTVEEVFREFGDIRLNIEIKEAYPIDGESEIEEKLWELIKQYQLEDQVLVVSFSEQIMDRFDQFAQGKVALGASKEETQRFVVYHKLFLNRLFKPKSDALQIPLESGLFNLSDPRLINGAHTFNINVHYWTINDEQEMRNVLSKGADGIITDRPDLLIRIMKEMKIDHEH